MTDSKNSNSLSYADAGVDIDAGNALVDAIKPMVKATARPGSDSIIGGFGGLFDLKAAGFIDPVLVAANDGVGTKLRLAIESGDHNSVGIDLVAMCVNDLIVQGAEPLFFLDYFATGALQVEQAAQVINSIAQGCKLAGCALIGGESAEMPGMYQAGDYDLAGFAVGAAERGQLLPTPNIRSGDKILGLASSGVHSNGFSLVRKIVETANCNWHQPAPFDPQKSLAQALLTPTRIYVKSILAALQHQRDVKSTAIRALAHITGGGFTENIPRVLPDNLAADIDLGAVQSPPVFGWLAKTGGVNESEMLRTFNCGIGMVIITAPEETGEITEILTNHGEKISLIGEICERRDAPVLFRNTLDLR